MKEKKSEISSKVPAVFRIGSICLAFLIIGYQVAMFVHRAAVMKIEADRDVPDTVYVVNEDVARKVMAREVEGAVSHSLPSGSNRGDIYIHSESQHSPQVMQIRESTRKVESFRFNPNTASLEEFQRLGFSQKQAQAIINYRQKGGCFRRKVDFSKSFVVADSVYRRLEPYINIPKIDINLADSAAFDALPGIGGYFARKMVEYRNQLGGYSFPEQLMDIYHFDGDKYNSLKDLITCSKPKKPFGLWTLPVEELRKHPYIRDWNTAHAIVLYRENTPRDSLSVAGLYRAGIISQDIAVKLDRCRLAPIPNN